ncbi:hypothetical protein DT250_13350 [Bacillus sp. AR2-1]|nr:hypothetical protein DT250_13350 [Bacillus sp. AR2-1]
MLYLIFFSIAIKPAILTAAYTEYNRLQFFMLLLLLILVSIIYVLILIRHNSRSSHSIANESILFIFSHIFMALNFFSPIFICSFKINFYQSEL